MNRSWSSRFLAVAFLIRVFNSMLVHGKERDKGCNSGVFIRTFRLIPQPGKDVRFRGIEFAIDDAKTAGFHDTGAFYDLAKPSKDVMKLPGQWNHIVISCDGPKLAVELNSKRINEMDLNLWTTPNRRPDGPSTSLTLPTRSSPGLATLDCRIVV